MKTSLAGDVLKTTEKVAPLRRNVNCDTIVIPVYIGSVRYYVQIRYTKLRNCLILFVFAAHFYILHKGSAILTTLHRY